MPSPPVYQLQVDIPRDPSTQPWKKSEKITYVGLAPTEVDRESGDSTDGASEHCDSTTSVEEVYSETGCYGRDPPRTKLENSDAPTDALMKHAALGTEKDDPGSRFDDDGLPIIEDNSKDTLADMLRNHTAMCTEEKGFWPTKFLYRIISRERLLAELERDPYRGLHMGKSDVAAILDGGYLRLFALLLLIEKGHAIVQFIRRGLSDGILPVKRDPTCRGSMIRFTANVDYKNTSHPCELEFMYNWTSRDKEDFEDRQWLVTPPYLEFSKHYRFKSKTILPWQVVSQLGDSDEGPLGSQFERQGAYGTVTKVIFEPCSHDFYPKLKEVSRGQEMSSD